jgi:hypothetical protein
MAPSRPREPLAVTAASSEPTWHRAAIIMWPLTLDPPSIRASGRAIVTVRPSTTSVSSSRAGRPDRNRQNCLPAVAFGAPGAAGQSRHRLRLYSDSRYTARRKQECVPAGGFVRHIPTTPACMLRRAASPPRSGHASTILPTRHGRHGTCRSNPAIDRRYNWESTDATGSRSTTLHGTPTAAEAAVAMAAAVVTTDAAGRPTRLIC